jgi:hypothetical protein
MTEECDKSQCLAMMADAEADARRISQVMINVKASRASAHGRRPEDSESARPVQEMIGNEVPEASKTHDSDGERQSGLPADALPFVIDPRVSNVALRGSLHLFTEHQHNAGRGRWAGWYRQAGAAVPGPVVWGWCGVRQRSWLLLPGH